MSVPETSMANDLVTIRMYRRPEEAHVARLQLEPHGISVFVHNENYDSGDGPAWPADGVWLVVPAEEAERAATLLEKGSSEERDG